MLSGDISCSCGVSDFAVAHMTERISDLEGFYSQEAGGRPDASINAILVANQQWSNGHASDGTPLSRQAAATRRVEIPAMCSVELVQVQVAARRVLEQGFPKHYKHTPYIR